MTSARARSTSPKTAVRPVLDRPLRVLGSGASVVLLAAALALGLAACSGVEPAPQSASAAGTPTAVLGEVRTRDEQPPPPAPVADGPGAAAPEASTFVVAEAPSAAPGGGSAAGPSDASIASMLAPLKPLQKVHYSWPLLPEWPKSAADSLALQYVRVSGAFTLSVEWTNATQIETAVGLCAAVNQSKSRSSPASIALNYSPWHAKFDKQAPPTDTGPSHAAELREFKDKFEFVRRGIEQANRRQNADVAVTAILLDSERFRVKPASEPGAAEWNAAIRAKHDAVYDIAKQVYPGVRVVWYGFGAVQPGATDSGWAPAPWHDLQEKTDCFSPSLYRLPDQTGTRETFERTAAEARKRNVKDVVPWVALASGYKPEPKAPWGKWQDNWDYDVFHSWQAGRELNNAWFAQRPEAFAPYDLAPVVCLYPRPFDTRTPGWGRHFVAYVRGANGIEELP